LKDFDMPMRKRHGVYIRNEWGFEE